MKTVAIDTNIAIDILNGRENVIKLFKDCSSLFIPITVVGELLFGAINSAKKEKNLPKYREFIDSCMILNINKVVAEQYSFIRKQLKDIGKPIPENDIWIAATCLTYDIPFITSDKHFTYINDLDLTII